MIIRMKWCTNTFRSLMFQAVGAALVIPNLLAAAGRADTTYSATLQASLTVSGFLDAEHNPISKPAGLTLASETFFLPDSYTEGDATADVDGAR